MEYADGQDRSDGSQQVLLRLTPFHGHESIGKATDIHDYQQCQDAPLGNDGIPARHREVDRKLGSKKHEGQSHSLLEI